jgi:hypothetical protein
MFLFICCKFEIACFSDADVLNSSWDSRSGSTKDQISSRTELPISSIHIGQSSGLSRTIGVHVAAMVLVNKILNNNGSAR